MAIIDLAAVVVVEGGIFAYLIKVDNEILEKYSDKKNSLDIPDRHNCSVNYYPYEYVTVWFRAYLFTTKIVTTEVQLKDPKPL